MREENGLNAAQKEAVEHLNGPLLVVAGAGAGKTRTIAHRIARLIERGVAPREILALTFTNKAAGEMRERIFSLVPKEKGVPLVTTFHSLGVRLLREFHEEAGVPEHFTIWDRDDSSRALKKVLESLGSEMPARAALTMISKEKGDAVRAGEYAENAKNFRERLIARAWEEYEKRLAEEGALDFDDLLIRLLSLLRTSQDTLTKLQGRFQHLLIDEYQDTNRVQYEIASLLAAPLHNICVVGDLDQCLSAGTTVTMSDGITKPIELVRRGDSVLSNHGSGRFAPALVTKTMRRVARDPLIKITTKEGRVLTSTPEHMHFAGYKLGIVPQRHFTYLMHKRGKGFRLGVSSVYTKGQRNPMVGFQLRCNHEHADTVWIIGVHDSSSAARVHEYKLSLEYRIPTLPFVARKGGSNGGYVHDQGSLDDIFKEFDTEAAGRKLLADSGLAWEYPHHRAQATTGGRRNVTLTLCGGRSGSRPIHRIAMAASNGEDRDALQRAGFSVRRARKSSKVAWRFESAYGDYGAVFDLAKRIKIALPHAEIVQVARLGGNKTNSKDGNSLPYLPAASVLPGMAMFDERGGYDIVEKVDRVEASGAEVYDLNVERTHNFVANGIVTHNCIYTWRQARLENLLEFERTFPGTKVVTLEQNYRSTRTILAAAASIIEKNEKRLPKNLFTENETGEALTLFPARDEVDEAWFVAQTASEQMESGISPAEIAVLYRENFQSRALEEAFLHVGIPYRVIGTRFFERKEVKDLLSYLRAALHPQGRADIARIIGTPSRGIGPLTLAKMLDGTEHLLSVHARLKIENFRKILRDIGAAAATLPASEAVRFALERSGIETMLKNDKEKGSERLENVHELVNLAVKFDFETPPSGIDRLLEDAALQSDQDEVDQGISAVSLMTAHASKGLEFDVVFITGLEQGLFPSTRESGERDEEEERRLFYVALTRARKRVFLTFASARMKYGSREYAVPSEFLQDIDPRLLRYVTNENANRHEEQIIT